MLNKNYFSLKELKITNEDDQNNNNIIKVKNCLFYIIFNCNKWNKNDFYEPGTKLDIINFLKKLNILIKSSNHNLTESFSIELHIWSLLDYLQEILEYSENNYEKLLNEKENDINNQIKEYDFESLGLIEGKLKYAQRYKNYYEHGKNLLIDLQVSEETKKIIEKEIIPVIIKFNLTIKNDKDWIIQGKFDIKFIDKERRESIINKKKKNHMFNYSWFYKRISRFNNVSKWLWSRYFQNSRKS